MRAKEKKLINVEIGKNIRICREESGYSREKLAELVGITPRFLADVETGFVGISLTNLKKICEILSISTDRLILKNKTYLELDEKISHIDEKYIHYIDEIIQKQLEIITIVASIAKKEENKTRK